MNHWTTIDLGTTVLVARKIDPFKTYSVEDLESMYDLLSSMNLTPSRMSSTPPVPLWTTT